MIGENLLELHVEPRQLISKDTTGRNITTSLIIAEATGKQHKNVLADIKKILDNDEIGRLNFQPSSYINSQSKEQPMYHVSRDGFTYLMARYTGKKARKFLKELSVEFNRREEIIREKDVVISEKNDVIPEREVEDVFDKITLLIRKSSIVKIRGISYWSKTTIKDFVNVSLDKSIKAYEKKHGEIKTP